MKVRDVMTAQVVTATPETSIHEVAKTMSNIDSGAIPIMTDGKVVGLVTDRDIVVRVVASDGDLSAPVSSVMSDEVLTCGEDDTVADAAAIMGHQQVRRLVVLGDGGRLAGILSLGDIAADFGAKKVGETLEEISAA